MNGLAWLGLIRESEGRNAKFVVRSYEDTIKIGSQLKSLSGAEVKVSCIRVREFEPKVRQSMTQEEIDKYKVDETTPGQNWILDVVGQVDGFSEEEDIYVCATT
jgi:hypothetical protein